MIRIRINGRGGQGGKTMAELLATMYYSENGNAGTYPYVSSAPTFGPERRGSPVDAFIRFSEAPIRELGPFAYPDMVIVLDEALVRTTNVAAGLKDGGLLLVNTPLAPDAFPAFLERFRVATIDADQVALRHGLGSRAMPIVNTTLLGAFVRVAGLGVSIDSLAAFIASEIKKKTEANIAAARDAYASVRRIEEETS